MIKDEPGDARTRLVAALAQSPVAVFEQDCELRYTWLHTPSLADQRDRLLGKRDAEILERPSDALATEALKREVLATGERRRAEVPIVLRGRERWYDVAVEAMRGPDGAVVGLTCVAVDVTEQRAAEEALRAAERRLRYLVALGDALRAVADPTEIQRRATRLLGEHLGASRVHFSEIGGGGEIGVVHADFCQGLPSAVGRRRLAEYGFADLSELRAGRALVVSDVLQEPRLTPAERAATRALGVGAYVVVPLVKGGELVVALVVHQAEPRAWTDGDVSSIDETAARTWADVGRARAEAALREAAEALRQSERRALERANELQAVLDAVPAAVIITRTPGTADKTANRFFSEMLCAPAGGERPRSFRAMKDGAEIPPEQLPVQIAAATGREIRDCEIDILFDDGERRQLLGNASPLLDREGRPEGAVGAFVDVTRWKRAEEALRETEARKRRIFETTATGVIVRDLNGNIQDVNPAFCKLLGYTAEELRCLPITALTHPDDMQAASPNLRRLREGELTSFEREGRYLRKDGQEVWVHASVCILPGDAAAASVVALVTDISQRREAEAALRQSEEAFRAFFHNSAVGAAEVDLDGRFVRVNEHLSRITGYTPEELLRMRATDLSAPGERAQEERLLLDYLRGGDAEFQREKRYLRKDGQPIWVQVSAALLRDASGRPVLSAGIVQEVTDRKRAEEALHDSNERLREADRRKTEFLSVLSHELRNPLAPIHNSIYLLERAAPGSAQATRAMDVLRRQTAHLTRLVDDLLDVTRISHGKITLQRSLVDLREIVQRTADDQRSLFQRSGVELRVEQPAGPVQVEADAARLTQILSNLLQNAAKFTPSGGTVTLGTVTCDRSARVHVRDTGVGIERAQMDRMFEPFAQADHSLARTQGGLGLGLTVARGLVELHGGTIVVRSAGLGLGTELIVTLPLATATAESPQAPEPPSRATPQSEGLILIIEDNVDAGQSLAEVLSLLGHRVHVARDGRSGLKLAGELRPGVVICDVGLPDVSGYDVARALRRDESHRHARLIALSGYAQPEDVQRATEAGFDAHIAKPPALDELAAAMGSAPAR